MRWRLKTVQIFVFFQAISLMAQEGNVLLLNNGHDGAVSLITVYPNSTNAQEFTVEGWIYPKKLTSLIFSDDAYAVTVKKNHFNTNISTYGIEFGINFPHVGGAGLGQIISAFDFLRLYEWNHVAVMLSTNYGMSLAINGNFVGLRGVPPGFYSSGSGRFRIGSAVSSFFPFVGAIDEVRISNIRRYCNPRNYEGRDCHYAPTYFSSFTNDTNTVALYHFNEPGGATLFYDSSGNGHHLIAEGNAMTADRMEVLRPTISMPILTNNCYQFTLNAPTGLVCTIESSSNWTSWTAVTNIITSNFVSKVWVPILTNELNFYRVAVPSE